MLQIRNRTTRYLFTLLFNLISPNKRFSRPASPNPHQNFFLFSFPPPVFHPIFYPSCPRNFFLRSSPTSSHHQGRLFLIIGDCQLQAVKNERYLRIRRRKLNCDFSFLIAEPFANSPGENINSQQDILFFSSFIQKNNFMVLEIATLLHYYQNFELLFNRVLKNFQI